MPPRRWVGFKTLRAVAPLVPLLQDKVKAVREETSTALAAIGEAALSSLLAALTHAEWLVRLHAVEALGKTRSPEAVDPLLSVLFNDRDRAVREDAVRALGQIGDARAVEFLVTAMKEPGLRPLAIEALGRIGDRRAVPVLINVLEGVDRPEVSRPIDGCGDHWDEEMTDVGCGRQGIGRDPRRGGHPVAHEGAPLYGDASGSRRRADSIRGCRDCAVAGPVGTRVG